MLSKEERKTQIIKLWEDKDWSVRFDNVTLRFVKKHKNDITLFIEILLNSKAYRSYLEKKDGLVEWSAFLTFDEHKRLNETFELLGWYDE